MNGITEDLIEEMAPYMTADLRSYLEAIGSMFDELDSYVGLRSEGLRWQVLMDPASCPRPGLPYLAQYAGETLPNGLSELAEREWVTDAPNQIRGTLAGIALAAQRSMVGARTVAILERTGGPVGTAHPEDWLTVVTYTADTPYPDQVEYDIRQNMPADIALVYQVQEGQTWAQVNAGYASWAAVTSHYPTWDDVRTDKSGGTVFSRPRPIPA